MQANLRGHSRQELPERRNIVPPGFEAVARHQGESLDIALVGELDMAATFKFESELERLLARHDVRRLVIDLAALSFVDSAGLGALIAIRHRTEDLGIEMFLANLSDPMRRILDLSGTGPVLLD